MDPSRRGRRRERHPLNVAAAFPADLATLALTRRFVAAVLEDVTVTEQTLGAAVLITNELASNAMSHARGESDVVVRLSCTPADLRIEVHDHDLAMTDPEEAEALPPWSGLQIVQAHCREWGVQRDGTGKRVWALLPLP